MPVESTDKAMLCYAVMKRRDDLAAGIAEILTVLLFAMRRFPGKPRILVLEVEGHRNSEKALDADAWNVHRTALEVLGEWFTEISGPVADIKMRGPQREDEISCVILREDGDDGEIKLMQGDYEPRPGDRVITAKS